MHELAAAMPHVRVHAGTNDNPVYQVGGKSFVFFRNPRPDAVDPDTGERYRDVIVLWVGSEADKLAILNENPKKVIPALAKWEARQAVTA